MVSKSRDINLEILRIVCMLYIILTHINETDAALPDCIPLKYIFPQSVNCFVLISGYFLVTAKFKFQRILNIAIETIFYSAIITFIFYLFRNATISDILKSFIPFAPTKFSFWFVNKYIALLALSPFLQYVCTRIDKRQYKILLTTMLLISSSLFLFFPFGSLFGNGYSLLWFVTLFITGGYLRLHYEGLNNKLCFAIILLGIVGYNICSVFGKEYINLGYNSLITYILAIYTFLLFKNLRISNDDYFAKTISFVTPHVFAAYLIHTQPFINDYMNDIVDKYSFIFPKALYLYSFAVSVIILSAIVDKIRIAIFKYCGIDFLINKLSVQLDKYYNF